ncbi:hypothetical protein D6D25_07040 [Aureobasidium pullulans]|nr:hypothetical protein D6D25_07040 [Aureobasidium pullulans]
MTDSKNDATDHKVPDSKEPRAGLPQRNSSDTTCTSRTTLPTYESLVLDTPPSYQSSQQPKKVTPRESTAGASAATLRAILGDPVPEEPKRGLQDRLLGRRPNYNRRPPSSERERGSSATWNVWGSPVTDPK